MLRVVRHQLAAELERILAGRMGQLVHEAFEIDRVLVEVHAAPEARRHVRVAHRVVDQQVRDGVAERRLRPGRVEPLEDDRVASRSAGSAGSTAARIDWPEMRMCSAVRLPSSSSAADELALRDRVVGAVQHVLLARPDQLDRRARHLLGDRDRLADIVVEGAAPAEAAAEMDLVAPRTCAIGRPEASAAAASAASPFWVGVQTSQRSGVQQRRGVHRLHGGVVLVGDRRRPPRPSSAAPASAALASPAWLPTKAFGGVEPLLQHVGDARRSRPWRSGPRPRRSAARRARSWPATRCRRRRRRRCRRPARPS